MIMTFTIFFLHPFFENFTVIYIIIICLVSLYEHTCLGGLIHQTVEIGLGPGSWPGTKGPRTLKKKNE